MTTGGDPGGTGQSRTDQKLAAISLELERLEARAQAQANAHRRTSRWFSRAHYGLGIPATVLATAAASTGLARYALASGITAGLAALLTAINTFLQKPEERSVFERSLAAKFESLQVKAERIRIVELIDTNAVIAGSLLEEISDEFEWLTRSADRLPNEPEPPRPVRAS